MRRLRAQSGQSAAEYVGLLLLVATIIGALATSGIPGRVADAVQGALCDIAGAGCPAEASPPERVTGAPPPGDADGDRVSDRRERALGLDPHSADSDGDGLPDGQELTLGADARNPDTDGDGLDDAEEADSGGAMRPNDADSDDDGLSDAEELAAGTDPAETDPDGGGGQLGDGLTDAEEIAHGTDPNAFDSDCRHRDPRPGRALRRADAAGVQVAQRGLAAREDDAACRASGQDPDP
jgi:Bacterial TSP3 repeat